jgi:hypothetical protein
MNEYLVLSFINSDHHPSPNYDARVVQADNAGNAVFQSGFDASKVIRVERLN